MRLTQANVEAAQPRPTPYLDDDLPGFYLKVSKKARSTLIDSGYRPDKPERGPEHKVYEFCRRHQRLCKAAKGAASLSGKPLVINKIEVTPKRSGREILNRSCPREH